MATIRAQCFSSLRLLQLPVQFQSQRLHLGLESSQFGLKLVSNRPVSRLAGEVFKILQEKRSPEMGM